MPGDALGDLLHAALAQVRRGQEHHEEQKQVGDEVGVAEQPALFVAHLAALHGSGGSAGDELVDRGLAALEKPESLIEQAVQVVPDRSRDAGTERNPVQGGKQRE